MSMNHTETFLTNITNENTEYENSTVNNTVTAQLTPEWKTWLDKSQVTISTVGK